MRPRDEWWPQDEAGPLPPWWFYLLNGRNLGWAIICVAEFSTIGAFALLDAPDWAWRYFSLAVWFGVGVQVRGIYQQRIEHNAKMAKMNHDFALRMGVWDRRMDLFEEAARNGYSNQWLKLRGMPDKPGPL